MESTEAEALKNLKLEETTEKVEIVEKEPEVI
jgi:hypothetical protein